MEPRRHRRGEHLARLRAGAAPGQSPLPLAAALFPLNDARIYFAGFGTAGMVEAQWLVAACALRRFRRRARRARRARSSAHRTDREQAFRGRADGFAFDGAGVALAIQLPAPAEPRQRAFLEALAELAIAHGGRANLIKESTLDATTARRAIAGFDGARARLAAYNPGGLHASELARRLAL